MEIEEKIERKFQELIKEGEQLKHGKEGRSLNDAHMQACIGWLVAAQNIVYLVVNNPNNPYRVTVDKICTSPHGYCAPESVGEVNVILKSLLQDLGAGLLVSVEDQTQAFVFDNFLDHSKEYVKQNKVKEAGVIAGVVFEDTLRTICRKLGIDDKDIKLDVLIDELVKNEVFTPLKAKRAKVSAHVRTKATHAQWDEFEMTDVVATIEFTEELISKHLSA